MKRLTFLMVYFSILSCQDVIEVALPTEAPKLVIDALIRLENIDTPFVLVQIKASLTSAFFAQTKAAKLDEIRLKNTASGTTINLTETTHGTGVYEKVWDIKELTQGSLELYIQYDGQSYLAKTQFTPTVPIDSLEQGTSTLLEKEETEVIITFTDEKQRKDFYLFDFGFGEYIVTDDTFYQGKRFQFSFFYNSKLKKEREVTIQILGINKDFYDYMNQLILQSGYTTGLFNSPISSVKGNIINITSSSNRSVVDSKNFALGYFAVCQTFSNSLLIKK